MVLKLKHKIDDEIYFFTTRKIVKAKITYIHIRIEENTHIDYRIDFKESDIQDLGLKPCEWVTEEYIYKTKEEFINKI